MYALRKCCLFLLVICMTTCDNGSVDEMSEPQNSCDRLLDKLEDCIGARPSLIGVCIEERVEYLLMLSCAEIISNLRGQ